MNNKDLNEVLKIAAKSSEVAFFDESDQQISFVWL